MATRIQQFFMSPNELNGFVQEHVRGSDLTLLIKNRGSLVDITGVTCTGDPLPGGNLLLFIAPRTSPLPSMNNNFAPAKYGWVSLIPPIVEGKTLYMSTLGAKSTWTDEETNLVHEGPAALALFAALLRPLRKRLKFPIDLVSIQTGSIVSVKRVGFSEGAQRWSESGGELRQLGVHNTRFQPPRRADVAIH